MAQTVKRLSPMRETWVRSLGREDPLEKEMARSRKESDTIERLHFLCDGIPLIGESDSRLPSLEYASSDSTVSEIELVSPALQADSLLLSHWGSPDRFFTA